ncbi:AAA-like domain-containing protein [candidate division KSB1 bacterium]|nr:AAA-like domain-containing protein [candidate division KSB1 bacterium]
MTEHEIASSQFTAKLRSFLRKLFGANGAPASTRARPPRASAAEADPTLPLQRGDLVARYVIQKTLGRGNMGTVYLAKEKNTGKEVALKFLKQELLSDSSAVVRFKREANSAAQIIHANIVTVYELQEKAQRPYIVMEYVEGETLRARVERERLSRAEFFDFAVQIAEGVRMAHRLGVIHRDLKPENILINRDGQIKIVDFGLAKMKSECEQLTITGLVSGTPPYMSPEQWDAANVDQRSDIFALGIIFHEMLAGVRPFASTDLGALRNAICFEAHARLQLEDAQIAQRLQPFLDKALEKNPLARYQTMDELLADLQRARAGLMGTPGLPATADLATVVQQASPAATLSASMFSEEGALQFYLERGEDKLALADIAQSGVTISIKGSRQIGKTALLRRIIAAARRHGKQVVFMDFQEFDQSQLENEETFFRSFCMALTYKFAPLEQVETAWQQHRLLGRIRACAEIFEMFVLKRRTRPLTLAMDNVDRILGKDYSVNFFSMLRAWHNKRQQANPVWQQFDLVLATSTEPAAFIADLTRSPFNVGRVLHLQDFTPEQAATLNERNQSLLIPEQLQELQRWVGGHPYLLRQAFELLTTRLYDLTALFEHATDIYGPFGDHLRPLWFGLNSKENFETESMKAGLRQVLKTNKCADENIFYRLQAAGLVTGAASHAKFRCLLYEKFFGERLHA